MVERPLQIVTACRARDLPILEIAARKLPKLIPFRALHAIAPDRDCSLIRSRLGGDVNVIPENGFIPGMTLDQLRTLPLLGFPAGAGWYFQQFLKLQFAFLDPGDDYYLIWDADTVPLRPMRFFDGEGRMLLTKAAEHHPPYFETYQSLFGSSPNYECSFIAQHLIVQKSVAREMMELIERRVAGAGNWAWKIMSALKPVHPNLFSEYETYGNFIKNRYPERVALIHRRWRREIPYYFGRTIPIESELEQLRENYDYAAFERGYAGWRKFKLWLAGKLRRPTQRLGSAWRVIPPKPLTADSQL